MTVLEIAPVVKSIDVRRTVDDAFQLFTAEISAWWPLKTHSRARDDDGEVTLRVEMEPRVGGRFYETLNTGEERDWGEVLAFEPGHRVRFSFQMGRPRDGAGEVEVVFEPLDTGTCRVTLTHSGWERYGEEGEVMRGRYNNGWILVFLECFGGRAGAT